MRPVLFYLLVRVGQNYHSFEYQPHPQSSGQATSVPTVHILATAHLGLEVDLPTYDAMGKQFRDHVNEIKQPCTSGTTRYLLQALCDLLKLELTLLNLEII